MSASKEPDTATIDHLETSIRTAAKPILVHCEAGADRSGLAAAIYELIVARRSPAISARQLSFYYGHFPWLWSRTGAMDRTFDRLVDVSD
jgi:protein tyrosine/serine phosphatase